MCATFLRIRRLPFALQTHACPAWVFANDHSNGYYRVNYRGDLLQHLTRKARRT